LRAYWPSVDHRCPSTKRNKKEEKRERREAERAGRAWFIRSCLAQEVEREAMGERREARGETLERSASGKRIGHVNLVADRRSDIAVPLRSALSKSHCTRRLNKAPCASETFALTQTYRASTTVICCPSVVQDGMTISSTNSPSLLLKKKWSPTKTTD